MSYDYSIGSGGYESDYIRIRNQLTTPITLRQFLKNYFNITDDSLNEALVYWWDIQSANNNIAPNPIQPIGGLTPVNDEERVNDILIQILNAIITIRSIKIKWGLSWQNALSQNMEVLYTFNRQNGVTASYWDTLQNEVSDSRDKTSHPLDVQYLMTNNLATGEDLDFTNKDPAKQSGRIQLKDLFDMGVIEKVSPQDALNTTLNYLDETQKTEFLAKWTSYGQRQWEDYYLVKREIMPLVFGTDIWLPKDFCAVLEQKMDTNFTKFMFNTYNVFWGERVKQILGDGKFSKAIITDTKRKGASGTAFINNNVAQVILIHRINQNLDVKVIDLTPFVESLSTSVAEGGGGFDINYKDIGVRPLGKASQYLDWLNKKRLRWDKPLPDYEETIESKVLGETTLETTQRELSKMYQKRLKPEWQGAGAFGDGVDIVPKNAKKVGKEYFSVENLFYSAKDFNGDDISRINPAYYHSQIISNDVILIKFETLKGEQGGTDVINDIVNSMGSNTPLLGATLLSSGLFDEGVYWDMIGLVDNADLSINADSGALTGSVSGTDLTKLMSIDQNIFYAGAGDTGVKDEETGEVRTLRGSFFLNGKEAEQQPSFYRMFSATKINGELQDINFLKLESVAFWTNYIFEKMAKIAIVKDDAVALNANTDSSDKKIYNDSIQWKDTARGIWKCVENYVDDQTKNLMFNDVTLASSTDSILGMLQQVCQKPWVEQLFDTYDNKFMVHTRIPPYTREAFIKNYTFRADNDAVLDISLGKETTSYSWYRVRPIFDYGGGDANQDYYSPSVFFGEFADMFGNNAYEVTSPYLDYGANGYAFNTAWSQAIEQLAWLVSTHCFLPFTRRGTITIKGDRTVRRGMNLYLEATDELFYITSVRNTLSINEGGTSRKTVIEVERGMVLSHYNKYFDLINTAFSGGHMSGDDPRYMVNWKVDGTTFAFLSSGGQFSSEGTADETGVATRMKDGNLEIINSRDELYRLNSNVYSDVKSNEDLKSVGGDNINLLNEEIRHYYDPETDSFTNDENVNQDNIDVPQYTPSASFETNVNEQDTKVIPQYDDGETDYTKYNPKPEVKADYTTNPYVKKR